VILVDANIPMYLVGDDHARKADVERILERFASEREPLVTDAEVFQEILHRYTAIRRGEAIEPAFDALRMMVGEVFPIEEADVMQAKDLLGTHPGLQARDALHVAVMRRRGVRQILTFDRGFEVVAGITRIS
jgi:uncharacterized protein